MNNFLSHVNDFLYSYILIFLLVGAGIYFSIRTRFVQLTLLKDAFLALKEKSSDGENASGKPVSSFQALMISTPRESEPEILPESQLHLQQVVPEPFSGCGSWQ